MLAWWANLRKNISTSKYIWIYLDILIYPPQSKHPNNISINSQNIQISILCIMDIQIINNLSVEGVWRTDHIMCRTTHNYRRSTNNNIISYYYLLFPLDRRRRRRCHYFHSWPPPLPPRHNIIILFPPSTNNNIISYYYLLFPLDRRRRRRHFHSRPPPLPPRHNIIIISTLDRRRPPLGVS